MHLVLRTAKTTSIKLAITLLGVTLFFLTAIVSCLLYMVALFFITGIYSSKETKKHVKPRII